LPTRASIFNQILIVNYSTLFYDINLDHIRELSMQSERSSAMTEAVLRNRWKIGAILAALAVAGLATRLGVPGKVRKQVRRVREH
jgi:hypothetical protein